MVFLERFLQVPDLFGHRAWILLHTKYHTASREVDFTVFLLVLDIELT